MIDYRCMGVIPAEMYSYNQFPSHVAEAEEDIQMFALKKNAVIGILSITQPA